MKKLSYLIVLALILGLVLTGCLSNVGQVPTSEQSGITYLTKSVPLPSDLVGLWHFSDNLTDSSGKGNDGTFLGGTAIYFDSPMGRALSFDGINDYVEVPSSPSLQLSSQGTIEFWFNPAAGFNGYDNFILKGVAEGTGGATDLDYGVNRNSDGSIKGWISDHSALDIIYTNTKTWTTGAWYHIAFTWSGSQLMIYVNGVSDAAPVTQTRNAYASSDPTTMGRIRAHWYNGLIDEVRIWNVALSPDQLGFIYDFSGILPPIKEDGSSVFKLGSTVPVKFQLWDDQGSFVTDAVANIFVKKISNGTSGEEAAVSTAAATTGNLFRYDSSSNQYIFNLATKSLSVGTWKIRIELDDGMSYYVEIGLK
jgi:hypothetical protein